MAKISGVCLMFMRETTMVVMQFASLDNDRYFNIAYLQQWLIFEYLINSLLIQKFECGKKSRYLLVAVAKHNF